MGWLRRFLRYMAFEHRRLGRWYVRLCRPGGIEFAEYWKRQGWLHSLGDRCSFNPDVNITDPAYTSIGNNCILSSCTLLGHDAVAPMLNNVYGTKVDAVGKVVIHDNCFIGHGAIVMPDTTIGPNSIVAAGAVVTKDVAPGTVVGGVPARVICTTAELMERMKERSAAYPWMDLIEKREGTYDADLEPELVRQRVKYFFGDA
jgi:acetyltransferase-like isoleucine patch superfamily enzyme